MYTDQMGICRNMLSMIHTASHWITSANLNSFIIRYELYNIKQKYFFSHALY